MCSNLIFYLLSHFEFLNFVTFRVFELIHILIFFLVLSHIVNLQISLDFLAHQKKSGWLYIWVVAVVVMVVVVVVLVVVVVVVVCTEIRDENKHV